MKTTVLVTAAMILAVNLLAQNLFPGFTINATPADSVADGIGGEETYVQWEAPFGTITLADFIDFYRLREGGGQDLVWFKQEILRAGDSQYAFTNPGEYKISYLHFSFFQYFETASTRVSVKPTLSLVPTARNYPPKSGPIVALGDSLTQGVGATRSNLVDWLEAFTGHEIINAGVSGDTTGQALLRITNCVLTHNPGLVIILLGGGDILDRLPVAQTFSNLHRIVALVQDQGAAALVVGIYNGLLADRYREEFHELYLSTGSVFVPDILKDIAENPFLIGNQLHPNDEGYRHMARRIAPLVSEIMGTKLTLKQNGSLMVIEWFGREDTAYDLLSSPEATAPLGGWRIISTNTGANAIISVPVAATNSQSFFAVRAR